MQGTDHDNRWPQADPESDPPLRIVVLGAGHAGLKAAGRCRRLLPRATVTVVDQRQDIGVGDCGLPLLLGGELSDLDALRRTSYGALRDPDFFRGTKDLEVRAGWRAMAIDRDDRAVTIERAADGSERTMLIYDKLVYALGARPWVPASIELGPAVIAATASPAAAGLRQELQTGAVTSCVVLGGGRMGVAVAAALADLWGCAVTVCEAEDRLLPQLLDRELSGLVTAELARAGVTVLTGCAVTAAATHAGRAVVTTTAGELHADRALVALGTQPRSELAQSAGLAIGACGGLVVDADLRTTDPHILAAGACIELIHHTSGEVCRLPLESLASRQGRLVGDVLAGRERELTAVVGSQALRVLDLNVAVTGLTATAATSAGLEPVTTWGTFDDRPAFHPDRALIHLALVHEAGSDRLLGLQAVGPGDVVKRVDVLAALLREDADLGDLLDAEFCAAPPYNNPLDPLHDLAAAALNAREAGLDQLPAAGSWDGCLVLDVRTAEEHAAGGVDLPPDALAIPLSDLRARTGEVPRGRPVLVVCSKGSRSYEAARILQEGGLTDVAYLAGGLTLRGLLHGPGDRNNDH
jgi:NADPH-dependent 2,4-dienoyl-CoA reductase/sulfur reductase-like enzyme/rhodanese-related sulfurtransferase